jgi:hypothetical protein
MLIAKMVLGCFLLGQIPNATPPLPPSQSQQSPATLEPIAAIPDARNDVPTPAANKSAPGRPKPPEMIAEAITLPAGSAVTGQPLSLVSALSSTTDRRQQLEVAHGYWNVFQTVAGYHFCLEHSQQLARLKPADNEPASVRLARASATAMLSQSELEATRAQCELARLVRLPAGAALPLPADRPLVGPYRTYFHEMFAGRPAPEPAALMDRILPIRLQAIDDLAVAVQAAEDALLAATEDHQNGRASAAVQIAAGEELLGQRRAFLQTVCDYNRNIADYGLAVTGPATNPQTLTAMLIGPVQQAAVPVASGWSESRAVQPVSATEPIAAPVRSPGEPTLAPPRDSWKSAEPTFAPQNGPKKNEPTLAPPLEQSDVPPSNPLRTPPAPLDSAPSPTAPTRTVNKPTDLHFSPTADRTDNSAAPQAAPLYPALVDALPAACAKQLTIALNLDRSLPQGVGKPLSLADCMLRDAGEDRAATIAAYWLVRQRAAEYQSLFDQHEMLDAFVPLVLDRRLQPSGATEMLRLRAAQTAAQAATRQAHVALIEAQYALALRIGMTGDAAWPLASTLPHSGRYLMKLDAQPQGFAQSWPIRRLAATIPGLGENIQQQAAAVVEADAARIAAVEKYRTGEATLDQALEGIARQTEQTLTLLNTLTDYNRAIAEYVLLVLPPATTADKLVAALVVKS